ncbi:MAG: metallophosphoesterase family protein [Acidimicrobiales bacterium]
MTAKSTSFLIAQISDIHLTASGRLPSGESTFDNFKASLREAVTLRPDMIVLTGDLTDAGEPWCYQQIRLLTDEAANATGAGVVYLPGNHDLRKAFRVALLDEAPEDFPINQVHWRDGLRVIALDSVVPGADHGHLSDDTLSSLVAELSRPALHGTIIALHHPPIGSPIKTMAHIRLDNSSDLAKAIDGSDVRLIICGHNHHVGAGRLGTVPVWVSPATAYLADVTSVDIFRGVPGTAISRIDILEEEIVVSVIPINIE